MTVLAGSLNAPAPTKAIRGWLLTDDRQHVELVAEYFRRAGGWDEPVAELRTPLDQPGDPLYAVWAYRATTEERPGPG